MIDYQLELPDDFNDYAWEVESKGWFKSTVVIVNKRYEISFYDQARLVQDISDVLACEPVFYESNLLVLKLIDRRHMEKAIEYLATAGKFENMVEII